MPLDRKRPPQRTSPGSLLLMRSRPNSLVSKVFPGWHRPCFGIGATPTRGELTMKRTSLMTAALLALLLAPALQAQRPYDAPGRYDRPHGPPGSYPDFGHM